MILHEFSVEPEALSDWQTFKYVMEKFGFSQGRVVSRFPKKWEKEIYENLKPKLKDVRITELEVLLKRYKKDRLIDSRRSFEGNESWINKAIREHAINPFYKMIAISPHEYTDVVCIDTIKEEDFNAPREEKILKTASQLADNVELLLSHSKEILFVDPYFDPNPKELKWWKPLSEILHRRRKYEGKVKRIEYHVNYEIGASSYGDNLSQYQEGKKYIPQGFIVVFVLWSDKYTPRFHGRYILTEIGGIRSEYGWDIDVGESNTTDISMLDEKLYQKTWEMFQQETPVYRYVNKIEVIGEAPI